MQQVTEKQSRKWFYRIVQPIKVIRTKGLIYILQKTIRRYINKTNVLLYRRKTKKTIDLLLQQSQQPILIYPPFIDWNIPLYQRPHHLAVNLAKQGLLYFFVTPNCKDGVKTITTLTKQLHLVPSAFYTYLLHQSTKAKKILYLYSNPVKAWNMALVNQYLAEGHVVIYDYLDELNDEVFGMVDAHAITRHVQVLQDARIVLLVTATKLLEDAKQYRPQLHNTYFVPNATDLQHFRQPKKEIDALGFLRGKKVIGYFGALAAWVDYELIRKLATTFDDAYILLLGFVYDKAFKQAKLDQLPNVIVRGPIPYQQLADYAGYFNVSIIPFLVNETTIATSPIKLFEYMALGKPIVSTDLPECRKYQSALIAKDHEQFIALTQHALELTEDDDYFVKMDQDAQENTWEARTDVIMQAIKDNLRAA